jgi:hypothetical protein
MTTPELERRLTQLLHERAEGAMKTTNTQDKLASLLANSSRGLQRRRWRWATGGLVAAAATAAVLFWVASGDTERVQPAPAGVDAVELASSFLEATYAFDLDRAEGMLSPDVEISGDAVVVGSATVDEWRDALAWTEAIGSSLVDHSCRASTTSPAGTEVLCSYTMHALGSDQLGRGPYGDNTLAVTIRDGRITEFEERWGYMSSGFNTEMWAPFAAWISQEHPADARRMYTDSRHTQARPGPVSLRLWEQRVADYVAARQ